MWAAGACLAEFWGEKLAGLLTPAAFPSASVRMEHAGQAFMSYFYKNVWISCRLG